MKLSTVIFLLVATLGLVGCERQLDPLKQGTAKRAKGDLDGAIADFNTAIAANPAAAGPYLNRGFAKQNKGDLDGAIADYDKALELEKSAYIHLNRGLARQLKGDLDGAIADCTSALEIDPRYTAAYTSRGGLKQAKGDLDGAAADYSHAIELDPKLTGAHWSRGSLFFIHGNWTNALADFRGESELDALPPYPHLYTWLTRARLGEKDAADQELAAYITKRAAPPGDWPTKIANLFLDKTTEADFIASAPSPDPALDRKQRCAAWYYAGAKRLLAGDKATAIEYFRKAVAVEKISGEEFQFAQAELKSLAP